MQDKQFLNASDVAQILECSVQQAYKVIRKLNEELQADNYITIAGKVSKAYFEKRHYSS